MKKVFLDGTGPNKGHYAPGVIYNGTLYISGQLSLDLNTRKIADGGIKEHMQQALANIERVLKAAGSTKEDVLQCRVYLTDINNWDEANAVYTEFFGEHTPARIVVPVSDLHFGCLVEIEAVAEVHENEDL